ncbi:hypothetical protein [Streptomyces sp. NPDC001621]|uniref:hypothetical protein n=1 Tax=Streptomyces sp. NPDC001621 TaxID=3364594 RepID=UPI003684F60E
MTLARSLPGSATEWGILLGTFVLYALGRWFFAWSQARRDGDRHPVRAAFAEEDDASGGPKAPPSKPRSRRLRVVMLWIIVPLLVVALSFLDFRQARKARSGAGA